MQESYAVAGAPLFYRRRHRSIRDECFADYRNVIFASPHVWVRDPIIETVRDRHVVRFLFLKQILEDQVCRGV